MRLHRRRARRALLAGTLVVIAACSGEPSGEPPRSTVPSTTAPAGDQPDAGDRPAGDDVADDAPIGQPQTHRVAVAVSAADLDESLQVEVDPGSLDDVDPFGRFATCSGLSRAVGVYSVLVASPDGPIRSLSLLTVTRIGGPGIYDVDVRIETRSGTVVAATGTLTIEDGLRSGSFVAFDRDGATVSGEFSCSGPGDAPSVVSPGPSDGVLDTIEVFALLRRGDEERVVGLAIAGDDELADLSCPGAVGSSGDELVRVVGARGAISTFDLVDGASPTLRLGAGGVIYEFDDVQIEADSTGIAGSFTVDSPANGVLVDGAFSCS